MQMNKKRRTRIGGFKRKKEAIGTMKHQLYQIGTRFRDGEICKKINVSILRDRSRLITNGESNKESNVKITKLLILTV